MERSAPRCMNHSTFNTKLADAQAVEVEPLPPGEFPFEEYLAEEAAQRARVRAFWQGRAGVLVYRRMRVGACFSHGCRDMAASLRWQLGALAASLDYRADLANFLEPWYGIGTVAGAYGAQYVWNPGQAPATRPRFDSVRQALAAEPAAVAETPIGRHTLAMIDLFLTETGGRLPMSLCDTQSPLNIACGLVDVNRLMMECLTDPEGIGLFLDRLADLLIEFTRRQAERLGEALVWPGHGFASSRDFSGLGLSDDNILMLG